MYYDFASVYDTLMDDFDYDEWSRHYLRLIRLATGELPRRAAECACGTGSLTVRLAQSGMAMTGVDLSAAMLRQAEKKARDYGVEAAFVRQDMKKLTLPRRVGARCLEALLCRARGTDRAGGCARVFQRGISQFAAGRRAVL